MAPKPASAHLMLTEMYN